MKMSINQKQTNKNPSSLRYLDNHFKAAILINQNLNSIKLICSEFHEKSIKF
jgi:hypothetical protein